MLDRAHAFSSFSVKDLTATRSFYSDVLGMDVHERPEGLDLRFGESHVFVYAKPDHRAASFTVLNFPVDDVEAEMARLRSKGVRFERYPSGPTRTDERGIFTTESMRVAWFEDPSGNVLSLIEDERKPS